MSEAHEGRAITTCPATSIGTKQSGSRVDDQHGNVASAAATAALDTLASVTSPPMSERGDTIAEGIQFHRRRSCVVAKAEGSGVLRVGDVERRARLLRPVAAMAWIGAGAGSLGQVEAGAQHTCVPCPAVRAVFADAGVLTRTRPRGFPR